MNLKGIQMVMAVFMAAGVFVKSACNLYVQALRHPLTTVEIDLKTGKVVRH